MDLLTGQKKAVDMKPIPAETLSQAARGAHARARKLSPERRSEIARKASAAAGPSRLQPHPKGSLEQKEEGEKY